MKLPVRPYSYPLPAISSAFVPGLLRYPQYDPLNPDANYFYPYVLYSPGHAELDPNKWHKEAPIHNRNRTRTFLMADSAGFQVIEGKGSVAGVDWTSKKQANRKRLEILRWIEAVADVAPNLDIPLAALEHENIYQSRQDCLDWTLRHWDFFASHGNRQAPTEWLNCLHGDDVNFGIKWHDAVKDYPAIGWAFGSNLKLNLFNTLWMILYLRDIGQLREKKQIHFFGIMHDRAALVYTHLQKMIQNSINPQLVISFDAASIFLQATHRTIYVGSRPNTNPRQKQIVDIEKIEHESSDWKAYQWTSDYYWKVMSENLQHNIEAILDAHVYAFLGGKKDRGRYFFKLWEVVDIMDEAWHNQQWDTVLAKHKQTLEGFFR